MFGNDSRSYSRVDAVSDYQEMVRQHVMVMAIYSDLRFEKTWDYIRAYVWLNGHSEQDHIQNILIALENRKLTRSQVSKLNVLKTDFQVISNR